MIKYFCQFHLIWGLEMRDKEICQGMNLDPLSAEHTFPAALNTIITCGVNKTLLHLCSSRSCSNTCCCLHLKRRTQTAVPVVCCRANLHWLHRLLIKCPASVAAARRNSQVLDFLLSRCFWWAEQHSVWTDLFPLQGNQQQSKLQKKKILKRKKRKKGRRPPPASWLHKIQFNCNCNETLGNWGISPPQAAINSQV